MTKKIKVSIVTIVKDGMPFLEDSLKSFHLQKYQNKELIVVYTSSNDKTYEILKSCKFISKLIIDNKSKNLYHSLNKGIKNTTGDIIGVLHSDDIFYGEKVLSNVVKSYKQKKFEIAYGNILIVSRHNVRKILRFWRSRSFDKSKLKFGWIPPHTSLFISKKFKGLNYSQNYKISSDYDYLLNLLKKNVDVKHLDYNITIMRNGGLSNKAIFLKFFEDLKIVKKNFRFSYIVYILKLLRKINQYYYFNRLLDKNNYLNHFYKDKYNFFNNPNKLMRYEKVIMSAYNMAYLSFVHNKINFNKNHVYLWPDGISSTFFKNIKKISGRKILSKIESSEHFENVYLISKYKESYLRYIKNKFSDKKFFFIEAPFGNNQFIMSKINDDIKRIKKKSLIILTLPTPKQEYLASKISNMLDNYKIVCIGGAIDYNSNLVKIPPKFIEKYFESIWRLRDDTFRRIKRLLLSILMYMKRKLFKELTDI